MLAHELPKMCPECSTPFSRVLKPRRKLQKKAWLLILTGLLLNIPWVAVLLAAAFNSGVVFRPGLITGFLLLALAAAPLMGMAILAMQLPKVVDLRCRQCGWTEQFVIHRKPPAEAGKDE